MYHVMARGDRRESVFSDGDRRCFLDALSEVAERRAREILDAGLRLYSITREDLSESPNGAAEKRLMAWCLKKNTTASLRWLSDNLNMGHISNVSAMIAEVERDEGGMYNRGKNRIAKILK